MQYISMREFVDKQPSKAAAARKLGIAPNTLWNRLERQPWGYVVLVDNDMGIVKIYMEVQA